MLDSEGYLALFERTRRDGKLVLVPPRRVFVDESGQPLRLNERTAGGSGRRKLCVVDWNGDGKIDLLLNSANADVLLGSGESGRQMGFSPGRRPSPSRTSKGTTSVRPWSTSTATACPTSLGGAEDGRFYFLANPRAAKP